MFCTTSAFIFLKKKKKKSDGLVGWWARVNLPHNGNKKMYKT
jgi:hypothetical protein